MSSKIIPTHIYRTFFLGLTAGGICGILSYGYYHPDEHFQILEYASSRLTDSSYEQSLPWEYLKEMRSGLLPLIVYLCGNTMKLIGIYNPFILSMLMRMIAVMLSGVSVIVLYHAIREKISSHRWERMYICIAFFFWILAYQNARFSAENISGSMIVICSSCYMIWSRKEKMKLWHMMALGAMAGIAFVIRYQMCIALLAILLYVVIIDKRYKENIITSSAAIMVIALCFLPDVWLYGHWTFTPYNYFYENIVEGYAKYFGEYGIIRYIYEILREGMFIFSGIILFTWGYYIWKNPRDIITWITVSYVVAHFIISHKEPRFLFPMLGFSPYFIVYTMKNIYKDYSYFTSKHRTVIKFVISINCIALLYITLKGDTTVSYYHTIYDICRNSPTDVCLINTANGSFAYHYHEDILYPREVDCHFYLPPNAHRIHAKDHIEGTQIAKKEREKGKTVLILSDKPNLSVNLPFNRVHFLPYPLWLVEHFNINNWVSRSSGMNEYIYEIKKDIIHE